MAISEQDLNNAAEDLQTIEDVVNTNSATDITSRLGATIKTLLKAIQTVGFKAEIIAWSGPDTTYNDFQQLVSESSVNYRLVVTHTSSGTFQDDLDAGYWAPVTLSLVDIEDDVTALEADVAALESEITEKTTFADLFNDFVVTGLLPATSGDLTSDISAGVAYVSGTRVSVASATSKTYTADRDTYVDIGDDGTFSYSEVTNGAGAPAIPADHIRLAKVVSDADNITSVEDLRTVVAQPGSSTALGAYVPDLAGLKALDTAELSDGAGARITSTGRAGDFYWDSSDLSAEVSADPHEGICVAPSGQDGSDGAWVRSLNGVNATPEIFGAKHSDPGFDNFPVIKAAFESGLVIEFPESKTYTCLTTGEVTAKKISIIGNNSVLAFDPALAKGLHIQGNVLATTTLASDAGLLAPEIVLTDASAITDDSYLIVTDPADFSFSGWREYYRKGDIVRPRSVLADTVTLEGPLEKEISSSSSQVAIVEPVKLDMSGLKVTKDGSGAGQTVWLDYIWDSHVDSLTSNHGAVSMRVKHALDSAFTQCRAYNTVTKTDSDGYGVSYINCKNVTDDNPFYVTVNNHACDTSSGLDNALQSTNVVVRRGVLLGGAWAASHHGGSENCRYEMCFAEGAILGGENPAFVDGLCAVDITKYSDTGLTSISAIRFTEMLTADFDVSGNTVLLANDNKDSASILRFVQMGGSGMIAGDTERGGILNLSRNKFRYDGDRDTDTDGDFFAFQLRADTSSPMSVRESTDIIFEDNEVDLGSASNVTAYQFAEVNDVKVASINWLGGESQIKNRLIQSTYGDVITDEAMINIFGTAEGIAQTLTNGVETTLYESSGSERAFGVLGGTLTGRNVQIRAYSDGDLIYDSRQVDPRGETSDGATVSGYFIPPVTGKKSVKVTATAYGADRVCGWHVIHKAS